MKSTKQLKQEIALEFKEAQTCPFTWSVAVTKAEKNILKKIEDFEKKLKNTDFNEWIQEHQEELPLGYSKAELLKLFVDKEVLGE